MLSNDKLLKMVHFFHDNKFGIEIGFFFGDYSARNVSCLLVHVRPYSGRQ